MLLFAAECQESQGLRDRKTVGQIKQFVLSTVTDPLQVRGNFVGAKQELKIPRTISEIA